MNFTKLFDQVEKGKHSFASEIFELNFGHARVPFMNLFVAGRQFIMAGIQEILQHPEQIEIHKSWAFIQ